MDHYIDITLLPDPEFSPNLLMNALFAKLHRGLVETGKNRIGVSFPQHDDTRPTLGPVLRLHGKVEDLSRLMRHNWLNGMRDHVHSNEISPIPPPKGFRNVYRVQAKSNPERLRRRYMKRHQADPKAAEEAIPDTVAEYLPLPWVTLGSHSTGQRFRLFIAHAPITGEATEGKFSHYGLSRNATIPWF
ncbi:MAG TPA: type I-F CRISPR-associated endoribonuclease Cas6/Csy4 [Thiolapillus brandeum]|uniref:Type I-F CRISPR-associated endoribonuclease Cas6/Csy4 n=1 Tax=Thiolapillus brandeum TaxID=1076588 RepID=A0A831RWY9_9GAMM|nr:type I-F CRISPR-associated endoribonuclease Cas6/Csy4 [Thiolapillus brandeum]